MVVAASLTVPFLLATGLMGMHSESVEALRNAQALVVVCVETQILVRLTTYVAQVCTFFDYLSPRDQLAFSQ